MIQFNDIRSGVVHIDAKIVDAVLSQYLCDINGYHGIDHWLRVMENSLFLYMAEASHQVPEDIMALCLASLFHDSARVNEDTDHGHGARGGSNLFAAAVFGNYVGVNPVKASILDKAALLCSLHTDLFKAYDLLQGCFFDADRLDLGRVGIRTGAQFLYTKTAKNPTVMNFMQQRAERRECPSCVNSLDLEVIKRDGITVDLEAVRLKFMTLIK